MVSPGRKVPDVALRCSAGGDDGGRGAALFGATGGDVAAGDVAAGGALVAGEAGALGTDPGGRRISAIGSFAAAVVRPLFAGAGLGSATF